MEENTNYTAGNETTESDVYSTPVQTVPVQPKKKSSVGKIVAYILALIAVALKLIVSVFLTVAVSLLSSTFETSGRWTPSEQEIRHTRAVRRISELNKNLFFIINPSSYCIADYGTEVEHRVHFRSVCVFGNALDDNLSLSIQTNAEFFRNIKGEKRIQTCNGETALL